jgi:hypothetical protein
MTEKGGIVKTSITKRVERTYAEDEVEAILIEHFRSKRGLGPDAPVSVDFDVSNSGGYLKGITVYFEDTITEEKPE